VEAEAASRRRALRGAGGAHLGQLETAASAANANASIVELETLALDERQQRPPSPAGYCFVCHGERVHDTARAMVGR
jgi:hypothetical protein